MSDSPFTRLQNLTRKPVGTISALRLRAPKLARRKFSGPDASISFRTSAGLKFLHAPSRLSFRSRWSRCRNLHHVVVTTSDEALALPISSGSVLHEDFP